MFTSYHKWSFTRFVIRDLMILKQGSLAMKDVIKFEV